ncbi:MAG: hypothetical protein HGA78_07580 [Nitrospirales bacterium]|nr:hypothetical protein [Nitrospirales bacterium]
MNLAAPILSYPALWQGHISECPYCDTETDICGATRSSMVTDEQMRTKYCLNEDFDDCPVFLAKLLSGR